MNLFRTNWKTVLTVLSFASSIVLFASCGAKKAETAEQETTTAPVEESAPATDMSGFGDMIGQMPNPSDVPALLQRSDISFDGALVNNAEKAQDYTLTNDKAAMNLGVYSTDLGYLCVYGQADQALSYFKASQSLVNKIGIAGAFEQEMLNRFEENLANKDTLLILVDQSSSLAREFLNENESYNTSALIVTGSFIEGLYIATASVANYPDESFKDELMVSMMTEIADQQTSLEGLLALIGKLEDGSSAKDMESALQELLKEFQELDLGEKIKNNDGSFVLKAEMLQGITNKVAEIRANIIG